MQKKLFIPTSIIGFLSFVFTAHAQYAPSMPGSLAVGQVTETSIEWKFNLNGALVNEVQLFVGDESSPRLKMPVSNYAANIVEDGLLPNTYYAARKIRAVYYGTPGAISNEFPAATTLQRIPALTFEPLPPQNAFLRIENASNITVEKSGWQLYDMSRDEAWDWISTESFQYGPFETGKIYMFQIRARNAEGKVTDWSAPIAYSAVNLSGEVPNSWPEPSKKAAVSVKPGIYALNVRSLAGISGKILSAIKPGRSYEVLEEKNGWFRISFAENRQGWVSGKYTVTKNN